MSSAIFFAWLRSVPHEKSDGGEDGDGEGDKRHDQMEAFFCFCIAVGPSGAHGDAHGGAQVHHGLAVHVPDVGEDGGTHHHCQISPPHGHVPDLFFQFVVLFTSASS